MNLNFVLILMLHFITGDCKREGNLYFSLIFDYSLIVKSPSFTQLTLLLCKFMLNHESSCDYLFTILVAVSQVVSYLIEFK